jgi:Uma2 family endonuclease
MVLTAARPSGRGRRRLLTAADLAALPTELPSGTVLYELDNGRLLVMPPPGDEHGAVELGIAAALRYQGQDRGHGKARCGEVGIVLWRDPDRVVGADAVFIANTSLPLRLSREGYLETIPDLVVEVVSKNDTRAYTRRKVDDYLATAGVGVVWAADPARRSITVHRAGRAPEVLGEDQELTAEGIIPEFRLSVREALAV